MAAKKKFLTAKEVKDQLDAYLQRDDRLIPVEIIEQLEEKIFDRAQQIAKKKNENPAGKTYLTQEQLDRLMEEVFRSYTFAEMEPGTSAGVVSAQSIGEPGTQMSLSGDEIIVYRDENVVQSIKIGEFIDTLIEEFKHLAIHDEIGTTVLNLPEDIPLFVPAIDQNERIAWKHLRQISRHPPHGNLIRVKTASGREIVATPSHSFLARSSEGIVPIQGSDLKVGDYVPLINYLPTEKPIETICVEDGILQLGHSTIEQMLVSAATGETSVEDNESSFTLPLDSTFGYLFGLIVMLGVNTGEKISIQSAKPDLYDEVVGFIESASLEAGLTKTYLEGQLNEIEIECPEFARIIDLLVTGADDALEMPIWVLNTPQDFLRSFVQAIFDHGATIAKQEKAIFIKHANSQFVKLISLVLSKFGIFNIRNFGRDYNSITIPEAWLHRYNEIFGFTSPKKAKEFLELISEVEDSSAGDEIIPNVAEVISSLVNKLGLTVDMPKEFQRDELLRIYLEAQGKAEEADINKELAFLQRSLESNAIWDKIVEIETVPSPTDYVYDVAVEGFETFTTLDGILTHNTLRTFHFAGVREMNVTLGLPRLIELVDARRNPSTPSMTVALKGEYAVDEAKAKQVAQNIELTTVHSVASGLEIDQVHLRVNIRLDKELLADKGITPQDIKDKIVEKRVASKVKIEDQMIVVTPDKEEPTLQDLQKLSEKLRLIPIKGLRGISRVMIKKNKDEKDESKHKYQILTEGSNFRQLMRVLGVDPRNSYTNHIHEIAETLGIEAARNAIIKEAKEVMEKQGLEVDLRHLMLVADLMTYSGDIRQIGRHGISGENASILARAGFEVTVKHLLDAAVRGEEDHLVGIIENVIVGQEISIGTGIVDLTISPNYREFAKKKEAE